ncbi:MAG: EcsC family protein [Candidatus Aminicenantales bacterium]
MLGRAELGCEAVGPGLFEKLVKITPEDFVVLRAAKKRLEHPSLAVKLTGILASPLEKGLARLPRKWGEVVQAATRKSIEKALSFAVATMRGRRRHRHSKAIHKIAVMTAGFTGGAFGLAALPIELPISTVIMLRSISEIARSEGEDPHTPETTLNCLQVFALGGRSRKDDAADIGYYAVRAALSKAISDTAVYLSERGLTTKGAPILARLITSIASRFGVVVSEEIAAMAVPAVGAIGGALINTIFMDHFQSIAQGHFAVRRLERQYGAELIEEEYQKV